MKKLMIVAAAAMGLAAFGDIESTNIVGYQDIAMTGHNGITWALSTFQDMSKTLEKQTIGSFMVPTDQGFGSGDTIVLEIYGSNGSLQGAYSFCDTGCCDMYGLTKPGWYPLEKMQLWSATDDDFANETVLPFGLGAIITSGEEDSNITFAGQVLGEKSYVVNGGNGITWTGNATPKDLKLGDLALPTDQGFGSGDTIVLEIYGTDGTLQGAYSFCDTGCCEMYGLANPGWYPLEMMQLWSATDDDLANEKVTIKAGQMVIITSGEADTTLTLPDPTK